MNKMPAIGDYTWVDRPVEMYLLQLAIDNAVRGPGVTGEIKRVLIVDDDPFYAKMVKEWIKDKYQTDIVTTGMQAISFLLKNKVNLILLDYEMPKVDGPQVLQMLRQDEESKDIPVVFLTGAGSKYNVERIMSLEPAGYIFKETTREDLLDYIKEKIK
ncbi:MAG: response regulator [Lachnospiraceae bacterium]|nr:response regulator [Lachnospiraceae bacterium]